MPRKEAATYEIGYGKPPLHTRFKKGQSGNPRGRPSGSKNLYTLISEALDQPIVVSDNGRKRKISKREAIAAQLVNKSAGADLKAIKLVFDVMQENDAKNAADPTPADGAPLHLNDNEANVVKNFLKRHGGEDKNAA